MHCGKFKGMRNDVIGAGVKSGLTGEERQTAKTTRHSGGNRKYPDTRKTTENKDHSHDAYFRIKDNETE